MIIDESDGSFDSLPMALDGGYVGTSHKNCKNVFKGIANACLIAQLKQQEPNARVVISGEDLSNIGPIALLQDLAVVATLGIGHAERNGHHYFRGLSMFSRELQRKVLRAHPELYRQHKEAFATVDITQGRINIDSVVSAPFGYAFEFDTTTFTLLDDWRFDLLPQ